jgi:catechol 2,3-dioxygenase-like lactoylglutathione lyase family enzyme
MLKNIRHTGIVVNDIVKAIKFYEGLGFKLFSQNIEVGIYIDNLVCLNNVNLEWAKLKLADGNMLELLKYNSHHDKNPYELQPSFKLGCSHIAFTTSNVQKTINYIVENGGTCLKGYQISPDGKVKVVYCHDLEGNIIEIVEEL